MRWGNFVARAHRKRATESHSGVRRLFPAPALHVSEAKSSQKRAPQFITYWEPGLATINKDKKGRAIFTVQQGNAIEQACQNLRYSAKLEEIITM